MKNKTSKQLLFERMHTVGGMPLREQESNIVDVTKTQEFKSWFGNSKIVDKNGNPLPVYHGSPIGGIESFERKDNNDMKNTSPVISSGLKEVGIFFTTNFELAKFYGTKRTINPKYRQEIESKIRDLQQAQSGVRNNRDFDEINAQIEKLQKKISGGVYQTYLKITNPFIFDAKGKDGYYGWKELKVDVGYDIKSGIEAMEALAGHNSQYNSPYDGIIAKNIIDIHTQGNTKDHQNFNSDVYAVFSPNQARIETSFSLYKLM